MGATATVKGGFYPENGVVSLTQIDGTGSFRRMISMQFKGRRARAMRRLSYALDGVAPGAAALETIAQVQASDELGGKRVIEAVSLVNRNTAASDVTEINASILSPLTGRTSFGANPPANKDGNPLGTR